MIIILLISVCLVLTSDDNGSLSRGFGDLVKWVKFDEAKRLNQDKSDNRGIFVLIHRSTCGACLSKISLYCI